MATGEKSQLRILVEGIVFLEAPVKKELVATFSRNL